MPASSSAPSTSSSPSSVRILLRRFSSFLRIASYLSPSAALGDWTEAGLGLLSGTADVSAAAVCEWVMCVMILVNGCGNQRVEKTHDWKCKFVGLFLGADSATAPEVSVGHVLND